MRAITLLSVLLLVVFVGCGEEAVMPDPVDNVSVGEVHNETLALIQSYKVQGLGREEAAHRAVNELAVKYGVESFSRDQVEEYLNLGAELATKSPYEIAEMFLTGEELEWFKECMDECNFETFEQDVETFVAKKPYPHATARCFTLSIGTESPKGDVSGMLDIMKASATFWKEHHSDEYEEMVSAPEYCGHVGSKGYERCIQDPSGGGSTSGRGWKKVIRFLTNVAVDGLSGLAAGAGSTPLGPGGQFFVAGMVGGLCSAGADNLLFGE